MSKDSFKNGQRASIRLYVISITGSQGYNKAPAEKRLRLEILVNTELYCCQGQPSTAITQISPSQLAFQH